MGHVLTLELRAIGEVLLVSLVLGAGLPVLFSLGIRATAHAAGGAQERGGGPPHPAFRLLGALCFAVVLACVALGIAYVVAGGFGKELSFEHVYPTFVDES